LRRVAVAIREGAGDMSVTRHGAFDAPCYRDRGAEPAPRSHLNILQKRNMNEPGEPDHTGPYGRAAGAAQGENAGGNPCRGERPFPRPGLRRDVDPTDR